MKSMFPIAAVLISLPCTAHAIDVYPGCAMPVLKAGHRTFYVDAVKGTEEGNGSAAKPWKDLSAIIGVSNKYLSAKAWSNKTSSYAPVNPAGPIKGGDVIMLMSGNYGAQRILNTFNDDFVWVMAAPGQSPVIKQLNIISSAKWIFQGITFQGQTPNAVTDPNKKVADQMVTVGAGDYTGLSNNVVFDSDRFNTQENTQSWTNLDWVLKPYWTAFHSRATCVSLTNSQIYNVFDGVMMGLDHNLMQGNTVSYFANDGVDLTHGDTIIRGNTFVSSKNSVVDTQHADAIQGWSDFIMLNGVKQASTNRNVIIENNTIKKYGDPNVSYLQGISLFDGKWDNVTIQNNTVITNTANGIALFGATNSKVVNNTVVASEAAQPMLWVRPAKDGTPLTNVAVRNNIAPVFAISDSGIIADHNIITSKLIAAVNGKATTVMTSQADTKNLVVSNVSSIFVELDNKNRTYDLRPAASGPAFASGSPLGAPLTDVTGRKRAAPFDIGSYSH